MLSTANLWNAIGHELMEKIEAMWLSATGCMKHINNHPYHCLVLSASNMNSLILVHKLLRYKIYG